MTKNIDISGIHYEVTEKMKKYVEGKIGKLYKYMPAKFKKNFRADVKLIEDKGNKNDKYKAEVILHLPNATLTAAESTLNMYAAIDIVEAKLKNQLLKNKSKHLRLQKMDRKGLFDRIRSITERDFWGRQN